MHSLHLGKPGRASASLVPSFMMGKGTRRGDMTCTISHAVAYTPMAEQLPISDAGRASRDGETYTRYCPVIYLMELEELRDLQKRSYAPACTNMTAPREKDGR